MDNSEALHFELFEQIIVNHEQPVHFIMQNTVQYLEFWLFERLDYSNKF